MDANGTHLEYWTKYGPSVQEGIVREVSSREVIHIAGSYSFQGPSVGHSSAVTGRPYPGGKEGSAPTAVP